VILLADKPHYVFRLSPVPQPIEGGPEEVADSKIVVGPVTAGFELDDEIYVYR